MQTTMTDEYQALFQRLADDYVGTVECERISDLGCRLAFLGEDGVLRSSAEIRLLDLSGRRFVSVLQDGEDGPPVLVSQVTSAVIAVCTR